jgi:choline monooxygenase
MSIIERPDLPSAMPTLPASAYRDPALFQRERHDIFAREWLLYGRSDQLPKAGDFLAATMIGYPVIVVRQADGSLRGFHNVCRHRAAMLT